MSEFLTLLAQASSAPTSTTPQISGWDAFFRQFFPLLLAMGLFYYLLLRGQKKERKKQVDMLSALKKNDRVQTIGGMLGTIVEVRDHEVVLKVDESTNTKIRFNRSAIKEVLLDNPSVADAKK